MAYYVNRNIKMTWWERIYIPEIIKGMAITSRHFFMNLFGFVPFLPVSYTHLTLPTKA